MTTKIQNFVIAALAIAFTGASAGLAEAGRGGGVERMRHAVASGSTDAIIAEVERAERLVCLECVPVVMDLLDDDRYEIREVAAWWFAKRPALAAELRQRSLTDLQGKDARLVRNAADFLGTLGRPDAIAALAAVSRNAQLAAEARQHAVRALGSIGHHDGNTAIAAAMSDADAAVRLEALDAWASILGQRSAAPVVACIADGDARIRARAAAVAGELREASARQALEGALTDVDPSVRRNAAWALGQIGDAASRGALEAAARDASPLVRRTAAAAIHQLH